MYTFRRIRHYLRLWGGIAAHAAIRRLRLAPTLRIRVASGVSLKGSETTDPKWVAFRFSRHPELRRKSMYTFRRIRHYLRLWGGIAAHAAIRRLRLAPTLRKTGTSMRHSAIRLGALICVLSGTALVSSAAQVVLVLRTGADSWQVLEAEKIAINSKSKVRIGSARSLDVQPGEYKKLPAEEILRVGILRRHAAGYLVRKDGGNWAPLAPDGAN